MVKIVKVAAYSNNALARDGSDAQYYVAALGAEAGPPKKASTAAR